ncbi:MAG TPA: hypothetical protein VL624_05915 [Caldimonas sp.]|jgi:hypothetical protein|nr:hypothetical protein [Caldimonas sp.]
MKKLLTLIAAFYVAAFIAACGGGNAGTPLFGGGGGGGCTPASAASGGGGGSGCPTASALTLNLDTASIQNTGAQTVKATATATTSTGQTLSGIPVTFSVDNNATFTASGTTTAADGTVVATVGIGSDPSNRIITVTATSGSLSVAKSFAVTGASLTGTRVPAVVAPSSANNRVDFRLVDANGKALGGMAISVTAGSLGTTAGTTGVNGDFSYVYTAPATTGSLDVVATAAGVTNTQTVQVQSTAIAPAVGPITSASVAANPSVVSTNTAATSNRTEIRALFVGNANAPVANVRVRFDLNGDPNSIGGAFSTLSNIVYSDAGGMAASAYIPGSRSSPTNGVTIRACYDLNDFPAGTCPNSTTTTITVVADALSVTIGSNDKVVVPPADLTYQRKFVVLVVDASGQPKANVDLAASVDIVRYWKGFYTTPGGWVRGATYWAAGCINEDLNRNGILEAAEDINHSGSIEPRKADVSVSILGTGKTDASGLATLQIEYPQNVATWARVTILVSATGISGTEGRATWTEDLPAPVTAFQGVGDPPFIKSPYGTAFFAMDPTTFTLPNAPVPPGYETLMAPFPQTTFPDGTAITPGVIADPCRNPF